MHHLNIFKSHTSCNKNNFDLLQFDWDAPNLFINGTCNQNYLKNLIETFIFIVPYKYHFKFHKFIVKKKLNQETTNYLFKS